MDSNVENILRNMVDGTTEYDPPHSRVEKLLIELKEALDAGGGGGTVDDVARNRINTHIDNSNVHVNTAEKLSWNDKVERSDLTAHTEDTAIHVTNNDKVTWNGKAEQKDLSEHADNGEIHVTAEEKAAWNGKAELSDIPSTLPANGGNADTVDGKHANEFMQFLGDVRNGSLLDYILSLDKSGFLYCGSANCTDMPVDGTYFMVEVRCYTTVKEVKATSFSTGAVYTNRYSGSKWSGWTNVANGGNADTVGGKHANELVQYIGKITSITIANDPNYGISYEGNLAPAIAVEIGLPSGWYHLKYLKHQDSGDIGWGLQIALPLTKLSFLPMYRFAANEETSWSMWHAFADGGNADTLDGLHANEIASNPNLLINPDFSINQRGITSASGGTDMIFIADRWYTSRCIISNNGHALTAAWDGVTGTNGYIQQQIEGTAELFGKPVTVSLNIDGARRSVTLTVPTEKNQTAKASVSDDIIVGVSNFKATHISVVLFFNAVEHTITNIKAEVGACETGYEIPITADELLKCQRYYQIRSTGDIAAVDMRPSMATIKDIKQRSDGNYEYIAEL